MRASEPAEQDLTHSSEPRESMLPRAAFALTFRSILDISNQLQVASGCRDHLLEFVEPRQQEVSGMTALHQPHLTVRVQDENLGSFVIQCNAYCPTQRNLLHDRVLALRTLLAQAQCTPRRSAEYTFGANVICTRQARPQFLVEEVVLIQDVRRVQPGKRRGQPSERTLQLADTPRPLRVDDHEST